MTGISMKMQLLRQSSIKVVGALISLSNKFSGLKFKEGAKEDVIGSLHYLFTDFLFTGRQSDTILTGIK
jgi:hypothetical protein